MTGRGQSRAKRDVVWALCLCLAQPHLTWAEAAPRGTIAGVEPGRAAAAPGPYQSNIVEVTAAIYTALQKRPVSRADIALVWVDITETDLGSILRDMVRLKEPAALSGGSLAVE